LGVVFYLEDISVSGELYASHYEAKSFIYWTIDSLMHEINELLISIVDEVHSSLESEPGSEIIACTLFVLYRPVVVRPLNQGTCGLKSLVGHFDSPAYRKLLNFLSRPVFEGI
jgi:hypothetical protein